MTPSDSVVAESEDPIRDLLERQVAGQLPLVSELKEKIEQLQTISKIEERIEALKAEINRVRQELISRGIDPDA